MLVAHDPGHGAPLRITGTTAGGIAERDLVLELARDVAAGILWAQHLLLRDEPEGPSYDERANAAAAAGARLVLCHHVNAYSSDKARGLMVFVDEHDGLAEEVGLAITRATPAELVREDALAFALQGDWTRDAHAVIEHYHRRGLPCVFIEWGFATSPHDVDVLTRARSRPAIVACAAAGIARAIELTHP